MDGKLDLGQMFMVGFDGVEVDANHAIMKAITRDQLGGVILFDYNVDGTRQNILTSLQLYKLTGSLQRYADVPLLVAVDQEGGRVCRLKEGDGFPTSVSAAFLGGENDLRETGNYADITAETLAEHGINFNLAPVVDLAINVENAIISRYERSYGADPEQVVRHATEFIQAHHQRGIACCLKHFPGHGSSTSDSHLGFVDITDCWQEDELDPYQKMFASGFSDAVMTAHVVHRHLDADGLPATLSNKIIGSLLRKQLGFSGVTVSDDLQMKAITDHWDYGTSVQMAVLAGVDLLVIGNNLVRQEDVVLNGIRAIEELLDNGTIEEEFLRSALNRVAALKKKIAGVVPWTGNQPIT